MKKELKAYQLFLIGLVVMLFGTYVLGGMAGGILVIAGFLLARGDCYTYQKTIY